METQQLTLPVVDAKVFKNSERRREGWRRWRANNQDKVRTWKKARIVCECGADIMKGSKFGHLRSKSHKNKIAALDGIAEKS